MTTSSAKTSATVLPLFVAAAIAVAGWVSYFFAQQEAIQLGQETEILNTKLKAIKNTPPPKPQVEIKPEPKPQPKAEPNTTATPSEPPKAQPQEPPKKYNRLLLAEREKALRERDEAQARIGTVLKEKHTILKQQKSALEEGQQLRQQLVMSAESVERLKQKIKEVSTDVQKVREQEANRFSQLKQQFVQELEQKQITISQLKNHMTVVNVAAEILFGSGSATLKPRGQEALGLIADNLNNQPDRLISIEGHTDNIPVGELSPYPSNWELSSARAASAARYLEQKADVAATRMQVVGHGEYQPTASNETVKGRAANRRIEIILLPANKLQP